MREHIFADKEGIEIMKSINEGEFRYKRLHNILSDTLTKVKEAEPNAKMLILVEDSDGISVGVCSSNADEVSVLGLIRVFQIRFEENARTQYNARVNAQNAFAAAMQAAARDAAATQKKADA